ncbi:MAG TPA: hypothetical protein ENG87_00290 [Candidatus Pacearchaeota archaeon]|nr:hypothetical protein BMS3Abin17_00402 [archaeon BMS3Abin17]HDK41788.1 hypothetical protein [Candidatus Pacearchaeota archaeon]HDZ60264.1 hypothetical protein [Candidatus Pacearchaeota archaeon]
MKRGLVFGLFFVLIGIFLINLAIAGCADSDSGKNYTIKGTVTTTNYTFTDVCDGNDLTEYYCNGDVNESETYTCSRSCEVGACTTCTENWTCGNWTECRNKIKYRDCADSNDCGTTEDKLNENQVCSGENINKTEENNENSNETKEDEKPEESKSYKPKKKLGDYYQNGECPEGCNCTGSTVKCELIDGDKMTVYAGKSGNLIVQVKGVNMTTKVTLYKDEDGILTGVFKGNKTRMIRVLPNKVSDKIGGKLENQTIELDNNGIYQIQGEKKARLFYLIPVREKVKAQINAKTGEIINVRNPWWGFLARDVKE